jgi:hypothetical protein
MSQSESGYWIRFLEGVEQLIQKESGLATFGAKLAPSLNGADPSFMNSVTGSVCRGKVLKYLTGYNYESSVLPLYYQCKTSLCVSLQIVSYRVR